MSTRDTTRRQIMRLGLLAAAAAGGLTFGTKPSHAEFPEKGVTWVIPFAAGGGTDLWGRVMAQALSDLMPQRVNAVNMPGASGVVGWRNMLNEPADGYQVLQGSPTPIIALTSETNAPLQPADIKIVAYISEFRPLLAVRADSPHRDWKSFLDAAKKNPGKIVVGATSTELIAVALALRSAGAEATLVPYSSTSEAVTDVLGGHIDAVAATESSMLNLGDKVRVILNAGKRDLSPALRAKLGDVPLASKLGYQVISSPRWVGVHPDTPDAIVAYLEKQIRAALETETVKSAIARVGEEIIFTPTAEAQADYRNLVEGIKSAAQVLKKK